MTRKLVIDPKHYVQTVAPQPGLYPYQRTAIRAMLGRSERSNAFLRFWRHLNRTSALRICRACGHDFFWWRSCGTEPPATSNYKRECGGKLLK